MAEVASLSDALGAAMRKAEQALASPEEVAEWERAQAEDSRRESLRLSGVHDVLAQSALDVLASDTCEATRALVHVRTWLASRHPILALFGGKGLGKTVAAAWALTRVPGRYATAAKLARSSVAEYGGPDASYTRALRTRLLVVDELGLEPDKDLALATLHDVIDQRQKMPRRTLLLGNMTRRVFLERYDARTVDRLREIAVIRKVDGESMRKGTL